MFPASVSQLDNGLTFIHQEIPHTPVVAADVWVSAGVTREPESWCGMAHFLEHMIFKGTVNLAPGVFDREVENRGGVTNAATSYDYAHYSLTTATDYLPETLPQLGELLLNAAIPQSEFVRERDVVLEEILQSYDDPDWVGFQSLLQSVYQNHPYGRSILGTREELMQHSPEAMRCFHHTHYQPENMTVVLVGGVGKETGWELVNRTFANFCEPDNCPPSVEITQSEIVGIQRQELYLPRLEHSRLMMAWVGPGVDELPSAHGLDLLSVLLGEGRTSRLVKDLREERQLVQGIGSSFSLQRESSLFTITAWLESQHLELVESLICSHLDEVREFGIREQELRRCQRVLCNDYAFSTETPHQLASLYGYYDTIAQAELAVKYPQQIQSFHTQELQQLAKEYLSTNNYAVTVVKAS